MNKKDVLVKNPNAQMVIIDTDPGIDDSLAIFLALGSKELNVIAVTTVFGNHPDISIVTRNACQLLELTEHNKIPVYEGESHPFTGYTDKDHYIREIPKQQSVTVHGNTGMGDKELNEPTKKINKSKSGPQAIVDLINENNGKITLITLGPLTNLARALEIDPKLHEKVKSIIIMGGALFSPRGHPINSPDANLGNAQPNAEANFFKDSMSAHKVFSHGIDPNKLILISMDITTQTDYLTSGLIPFFEKEPRSSIREFIFNNHNYYIGAYLNVFKRKIVPVHDCCAIFYAINPFAFINKYLVDIKIETEGKLTKGMTIIDNRTQFPGRKENATIYQTINTGPLYKAIMDSIIVLEKYIKN